MTARFIAALETISVEVSENALEAYEAALGGICASVGFFKDEATGRWRVEGVRETGAREEDLRGAIAIAAAVSGESATLTRTPTAADGWLARSYAGFPEQLVGKRFVVRGSHLTREGPAGGRIALAIDAGVAFGSGEHGSTRGCLRALEAVAHRKPRRILDLGTGSGILAIAAARLLRRRVRATDIEPWSVRVAKRNARQNGVGPLVHPLIADGWRARPLRRHAPYDLVLANILARPLCRMAWPMSAHVSEGASVILAGLLASQVRLVLGAHRRRGFRLERIVREGSWATLVLRARPRAAPKRAGVRRRRARSPSARPSARGSVMPRENRIGHKRDIAPAKPDIRQLAIGHGPQRREHPAPLAAQGDTAGQAGQPRSDLRRRSGGKLEAVRKAGCDIFEHA